jgi:hypothetical protein
MIRRFQAGIQRRLVVAAVVLQCDRRLIRKGVGRDEVLPPDRDAIRLRVIGAGIDQTLEQECRFGPPSAAARAALEAITAIERLEALTERLLDAESWEELIRD